MYHTTAIALMIGCTVAANLLLKVGAMVPSAERTILGVWDWRTFLGFVFFGGAAIIYSGVLQWLPLNVAQSISASQFVAVILASALILAEPIPTVRLVGIVLIVTGIAIVSFSHERSQAAEQAATSSAEHEPR